jgi:hypothetical protein
MSYPQDIRQAKPPAPPGGAIFMKKLFSLSPLFALLAGCVHAELLPEAVLAFPAETTVLEYDSLSTLRALPNYQELRKQYSSAGFERARKDLLALGISEDQVTEAVMATGPNGFFGLLAGTFRASLPTEAVKQGMTAGVLEKQAVFCAEDGMCFLFLTREGGRVLFGTSVQLRAISEVMQGRAPSLLSNGNFSDLIGRMEPHSTVVGVAPGSKILLWAGDGISRALSSSLDLTKISANIESFGYSVTLDGHMHGGLNHVGLNLVCRSEQSASLLRTMLAAASGLERAATLVAGAAALPFNKMVVSSTGRLVAVKVDAAMQ